MSRPFKKKSHDGATGTGAGESHFTRSHTSLGVFAVARNLDPTNDSLTVSLEGGFKYGGNDYFSPIYTGGSDKKASETEFTDDDGDGTYTMFLWASNVPAERVRARITEFTDDAGSDLEVDTFVLGSNNASGGGHSFEPDSS